MATNIKKMNTKLLMTISSVLMGLIGIALTFLSSEILNLLGSPSQAGATIGLQMAGALYFGFAMVNWTAKANLIGGIYGRPIAIGNSIHFFIGALALIKAGFLPLLPLTIMYSVLAVAFYIVLITHPIKETSNAAI